MKPSIEQQRREAERLVEEYLAPVPGTEPRGEAKKKVQALVEELERLGSVQSSAHLTMQRAFLELGTDALTALRRVAEKNQQKSLSWQANEIIRAIEVSTKYEAVNSLRLLGWAATDVLRDRLEKVTRDREKNALDERKLTDTSSGQRDEDARKNWAAEMQLLEEQRMMIYEQQQRLGGLWQAVEPVRQRLPQESWRVPPEYCYGGRRIECPAGLEHVYQKLTPEEAAKSGGVAEEYCRRKAADGTFVKQGPYTLWGPNGEACQQGEFADGERDGRWVSTSTGQVAERWYSHGEIVSEKTTIVGEPQWFVIDFDAANRQRGVLWCALGSTTYEIIGREGEFCRMRYTGEIESAGKWSEKTAVWVELLVPRSLGKRTFSKRTTGVDFSSLQQYLVKPGQKGEAGPATSGR